MALVFTMLGALAGTSACSAEAAPPPPTTAAAPAAKTYKKPSEPELRTRLSPLQYKVTQEAATEPAFMNSYWDNHEPGLYVDVVTGEPLFASYDKFDSGTGWPSFTTPIEPGRVVEKADVSHGMERVEMVSKAGASHIGHVFDDGPQDRGGRRYCANSAALRFIPLAELDAAGYGAYRAAIERAAGPRREVAMLAGGCFWGMEEILRKIPGVLETEVGYTGGTTENPTYEALHDGTTGHAESVRVVFDPTKLSYSDLLEKWFFHMHDPTTPNRQGNDIGSQYRSAIFATTPEQKRIAREVKARVTKSGLWSAPIVTEIVDAGVWTPAEDYHQDYLERNPDGYTCHYLR